MRRSSRRLALAGAAAALVISVLPVSPAAATGSDETSVAVIGYDIDGTAASGFGCWTFAYTGTATNTGRTVDGTACPSVPVVDLAGGTGTLADGTAAVGQLFTNRADEAGTLLDPRLVLHLATTARISRIDLIGDTGGYSWAAGFITGLTVEIGDQSQAIETLPTGAGGWFGNQMDDRVDLSASTLGDIVTDTIVLDHITSAWSSGPIDQYTIAEIEVFGTPVVADTTAPVVTFSDHPATYVLTDTVVITCSASDDVGVVGDTCYDIDLPAWELPGSNFVDARAWDAAGNVGYGSTTFETIVTYDAMKILTADWVWKAGVKAQLIGYLDTAAKAEAKGNLKAEASNLESYRALLKAQIDKAIDVYNESILWGRSTML